jgi:hypothetical protein
LASAGLGLGTVVGVGSAAGAVPTTTSVNWATGLTFGTVGNAGPGAVADCAVAAVADIEQILSLTATPPDPAPYLTAYDELLAAARQAPGATAGLVPASVLARWETAGIAGTRIRSATRTSVSVPGVERALASGPLYGVIDLPATSQHAGPWINASDTALSAWTSTTPPSGYSGSGLHVVAVVGYSSAGILLATWGYVQPVSWPVWSQIALAAWSVHR